MLHQRKHIRLRGFDYSSANSYFITVCVKDSLPLLGIIRNGICGLNEIGNTTAMCLQSLSEHHAFATLDEFVIMPNHLHFIISLHQSKIGYAENRFSKPISGSVSVIVNQVKGAVKKWCNANGYTFEWQGRFYDHIIRNGKEYHLIREYIINNPRNWKEDRFHKL